MNEVYEPVPRPRRRRVADRVPDRVRERARRSGRARPPTSSRPISARCSTTILDTVPAPTYDPEHPLQALVTNLDAEPVRRPARAAAAIRHGTLRKGAQIAWCRADGTISHARVTELYVTEALDRVPADEAGPGEIVALAGLPDVTIGETIADPDDPRPLPVTTVDEPCSRSRSASTRARSPAPRATRLTASHGEGAARRRSSSATSRCASSPPRARTRGRCRAAASCSSRCSSSSCAARASS